MPCSSDGFSHCIYCLILNVSYLLATTSAPTPTLSNRLPYLFWTHKVICTYLHTNILSDGWPPPPGPPTSRICCSLPQPTNTTPSHTSPTLPPCLPSDTSFIMTRRVR